jgi:hypothetical protein
MVKLVVCFVAASVAFGCSADYLIWIPRSSSAEPLYRFIKDGKAGYRDFEVGFRLPILVAGR